jgi:predicted DNA binding CopG/RHH family protein
MVEGRTVMVCIRMSEEERNELKAHAAREGISLQDLITQLLQDHYPEWDYQKPDD